MFSDFREFEEGQKKKEAPSVYNPQGDIRQCNEGKYEWLFSESEDKTCLVLDVYLPKFMDTSLIQVDLNPQYIRLDIKGKITQLKFEQEIVVEKSKVQRSTTTGVLQLRMPLAHIPEIEVKRMQLQKLKDEKAKEERLAKLAREQEEAKKRLTASGEGAS